MTWMIYSTFLNLNTEQQVEGALPKVRGLGLQGCSHVTPRKVILQPVMTKKPFTKGTPDKVT